MKVKLLKRIRKEVYLTEFYKSRDSKIFVLTTPLAWSVSEYKNKDAALIDLAHNRRRYAKYIIQQKIES